MRTLVLLLALTLLLDSTLIYYTTAAIIDPYLNHSCCYFRHCPADFTCVDNADGSWGCRCQMSESRQKFRETQARAVRKGKGTAATDRKGKGTAATDDDVQEHEHEHEH